jgi:anti-sigma factor ChrR (cupin superfamily)
VSEPEDIDSSLDNSDNESATPRFEHELGLELDPVAPPATLRTRVLTAYREEVVARTRPIVEISPGKEPWQPTGRPGSEYALLFRDQAKGTSTVLLKLEPGATYPTHLHHEAEQCYVISGDIGWGSLRYHSGEFIVSGQASLHPEINSMGGCTLLLVMGRQEFV